MTTDWQPMVDAAAAAAASFASTPPTSRAGLLVAIADRLDAAAGELIALGMSECGLTEARLSGELRRTSNQLRLFAEVVIEGAYLDVRIDQADPDHATGARPDLRRMNMPVGPVLVFAASNFPLAFSVAGGDTAAALAAGCPVLLKAHSGHPRLSARTAQAVHEAVAACGLPAGVFGLVRGQAAGTAVLKDERIRAASFTGSTAVGVQLQRIALTERITPIPFFGELGSLNPAIVTPAAAEQRIGEIIEGFLASVAGSAGQLCTKPGFLLLPAGVEVDQALLAADEVAEQRLLTPGISTGYAERLATVTGSGRVRVILDGGLRLAEEGYAWVRPTIVETTLPGLVAEREALLEETFGPFSVIVRYDSPEELLAALPLLFPGNLTATLQLVPGDEQTLAPLIAELARLAGRVLVNGWPTGVSVSPAMQHGGPFPATTIDQTSVGTAAIGRFLRAVCYQNVPQVLLPEPLRDDNPWQVPQRRSAAGLSQQWGTLSGRY